MAYIAFANRSFLGLAAWLAIVGGLQTATAAPKPALQAPPPANAFVPGTGSFIEYASDDFEDDVWSFDHRFPKSSREQDENVRYPMGKSANGRWHEGPERGQPDVLQPIATPAGGLDGSRRALLLRTLNSGIPGFTTRDVQQDDLIANCVERLRGGIPVGERPSVTVRVYLPPAEQWERRQGPHFGFRTSASTVSPAGGGLFSSRQGEVEPYWPGLWIHFRPGANDGSKPDSAWMTVRANRMGHDYNAKEITQFGWWTLGMSYSADGMVHYYASPGVDDLTPADYIASQYPYGFRAQQFRTYFFDVCNRNDGRTWSTPFVIDDPKLYVASPDRVNAIVERAERQAAQREARKAAAAQRSAAAPPRSNNSSRSARRK